MKKILLAILLTVFLTLISVTANNAPYDNSNKKPKLSNPLHKITEEQKKKYTSSYINDRLKNYLIPKIIKYLEKQEIKLYRTKEESDYIGDGIKGIIEICHDNKELLFYDVLINVRQLKVILHMDIMKYDEKSSSEIILRTRTTIFFKK